jgi:hypothetical protein
MSQRISKSIWLVALLVAVLLGIWPGVGLGQEHWIFWGAVFGWAGLPMVLFALITPSSSTDSTFWLQLLTAVGYPLAMLGYSACAYWAIRRTGLKRIGLIVAAISAGVSTLASIPAFVITASINQNDNVFRFFSGYFFAPSVLVTHGIILLHLLISAILGWLISMGLIWLIDKFSNHTGHAATAF